MKRNPRNTAKLPGGRGLWSVTPKGVAFLCCLRCTSSSGEAKRMKRGKVRSIWMIHLTTFVEAVAILTPN